MRPQQHDPAEPAVSLAGLPEPERLRVLGALSEAFVGEGYHATSTDELQARIDPLAFERLFADKEDCFLQVFDFITAEARAAIAGPVAIESSWPRRLAAGLWTLLTLIDAQPTAARVVLVEAQAASPEIFGHFLATVKTVSPFMREGRLAADEQMPVLADSFLPNGIASILGEHLKARRAAPVSGLYDGLLRMSLSYYSASPEVAAFLAAEPLEETA